MPCRVDLIRCDTCGREHYFNNECLVDPSKRTWEAGALCDVLRILKGGGGWDDIPSDVIAWWAKHVEAEKTAK